MPKMSNVTKEIASYAKTQENNALNRAKTFVSESDTVLTKSSNNASAEAYNDALRAIGDRARADFNVKVINPELLDSPMLPKRCYDKL